MKITVITVSDRAHAGTYSDRSGPAIESVLAAADSRRRIVREVVPDDPEALRRALEAAGDSDWIITTGGTGIGPRDVTPEVTASCCDRELPGVAQLLRHESLRETPFAAFSRGSAGVRGQTIIVNFPGSERGARFCAEILSPIMEHGTAMVRGGGH
jgi:molybdopterin adenylyltransferase